MKKICFLEGAKILLRVWLLYPPTFQQNQKSTPKNHPQKFIRVQKFSEEKILRENWCQPFGLFWGVATKQKAWHKKIASRKDWWTYDWLLPWKHSQPRHEQSETITLPKILIPVFAAYQVNLPPVIALTTTKNLTIAKQLHINFQLTNFLAGFVGSNSSIRFFS